ncbi:hypothetical protein H0266_02450 [Halobacillus locisalis]|uniref:Uncharacterized protein n=1 Tax=Halobacillus locisalis TaxID=220753 RepID=A0A838CP89_9BACI|nr:hypothetical protein [Halobacillus locisalis]MBA2173751.1 hypothetical protein [Halobacillus locisalis]
MNNFRIQQQIECPLIACVAGYEVELIDPDNLIYEIRNIEASNALSNWIIELDLCPFENCLVGEVFDLNDDPVAPNQQGVCRYPSQNNERFACTDQAPCDGVITGLKFDELDDFGELKAGFGQQFQIVIDSEFELHPACFQLKFGQNGECGQICAPVCVNVDQCDNPCECDAPEVFSCEIDLPSCFTFDGTFEDVSTSFCIGDSTCEMDGECETFTTINVCGQQIQCCVPVNRWRQSVNLEIVFNAPLSPVDGTTACGGPPIVSCLVDDTFTKQCFSCPDDMSSPCVNPRCENVVITPTDTDVSTDEEGNPTLTIFFTVTLPPCSTEL